MKGTNYRRLYDQMGCEVIILRNPRIISLVPSQTELLFSLGLTDQIVGVTKFCAHPKSKVKNRTKVGGTKNFKFNVINDLCPDLIIGNKEENYAYGIKKLKEKYPVWMSDIHTLNDAYDMIKSIGKLTNKERIASQIINQIKAAREKLKPHPPRRVLYFIWQKPYMVAGENTFIDEMLQLIGFKNAACKLNRYPELSIEDIIKLEPEVIFLSSEPFPFQEKHKDNFKKLFPFAEIELVDGEMFSWYGPRLIKAFDYFNHLQF